MFGKEKISGIFGFGVFALALLSGCAEKESDIKKTTRLHMVAECTAGMSEEVDNPEKVRRYCDCFARYFVARYTDVELAEIALGFGDFEARINADFESAFHACQHILG